MSAQIALAAYQIIAGAQQAEALRENARLSREINELNAQYAELDAYNADLAGYTQQARYQTVIDQTLGEQKSVYAAQGVDIGFGTAKEVQQETKLNGSLNLLDIRNKAHEVALGYKKQAENFRLSGSTAIRQGDLNANAAQVSATVGAVTTMLPEISSWLGAETKPTKKLASGYTTRRVK